MSPRSRTPDIERQKLDWKTSVALREAAREIIDNERRNRSSILSPVSSHARVASPKSTSGIYSPVPVDLQLRRVFANQPIPPSAAKDTGFRARLKAALCKFKDA